MKIALSALIFLFFFGAFLYSGISSSTELSVDGQVIQKLIQAGSNTSKKHEIDFFFYFPTVDAANRISHKLKADGFASKDEHSPNGSDFSVLASKSMVPTEAGLIALREKFNAMSASENGKYDGWGAEVVK